VNRFRTVWVLDRFFVVALLSAQKLLVLKEKLDVVLVIVLAWALKLEMAMGRATVEVVTEAIGVLY